MGRLVHILTSLRKQPSYTLVRGVARFASIRGLVTRARSTLDRNKVRRYIAECDARLDSSCFQDLDRLNFVRQLRDDGVAFGLRLPEQIVREIRDFAEKTPCYADRIPSYGFRLLQHEAAQEVLRKPILLAQYFNTAEQCPAIEKLVQDPVLQWIACKYLESIPTFVGANLWWTFPVNASEEDRHRHAHMFHRDVDDFRFFKFFFYLTDVAVSEGAHVCIVASHRRPPLVRVGDRWNIRRYSDTEIESCFSQADIMEICGPAGTGFAENTLCIHKGRTPTTNARLLLQLQYALFDHGVMHDRRESSQLVMIA